MKGQMVISRYADIKFATPRPLNIREWNILVHRGIDWWNSSVYYEFVVSLISQYIFDTLIFHPFCVYLDIRSFSLSSENFIFILSLYGSNGNFVTKEFFSFFFWETWFLTISGGNRIPITVDNRDWIVSKFARYRLIRMINNKVSRFRMFDFI